MVFEILAVALIAVLLYLIKRDLKVMLTDRTNITQHFDLDINAQILASGFDIRAQILEVANAHLLWTISRIYSIQDEYPHQAPGPSPPPPPMILIISGIPTCVTAEIRFQQFKNNRHIHRATFMVSEAAQSVEGALRNLLNATSTLIDDEDDEEDENPHAWRGELMASGMVDVVGMGYMCVADGECRACREVVWS
ncbi:hypothetical protein LTR15_000213 [Elasticomyces elasticus]|nr:hypothetical protein LTR15_000213 [Elasticomyces elasticus]